MPNDPIRELRRIAHELKEADDFNEPTQPQIAAPPLPPIHVHLESVPDADERPRGLAGWIKLVVAALGAGLAMGLVTLVEQCQHVK